MPWLSPSLALNFRRLCDKAVVCFALVLGVSTGSGGAQTLVLNLPETQSAMDAMRSGHPEVALQILDQELLAGPATDNNLRERIPLARLRLEALARLNDWNRIRTLTEAFPLSNDPPARFWRAMALSQTGEADAAAMILAPLAEMDHFPLQTEALLNLGAILIARGDFHAAVEKLDSVSGKLPTDSPTRLRLDLKATEWTLDQGLVNEGSLRLGEISSRVMDKSAELQAASDLLEARLAASHGNVEEAASTLRRLITLTGIPSAIQANASWQLAALEAKSAPGVARDRLLVLIETQPRSTHLENLFRLLEDVLNAPVATAVEEALHRWASDDQHPDRKLLAGHLLAHLPGSPPQEQEARLEAFGRSHLSQPVGLMALYEAGLVAVQDARLEDATKHEQQLRTTERPKARSLADSLLGRTAFARGDLVGAAEAMESAARAADVPRRLTLAHRANASLACALAGNRDAAAKWSQSIAVEGSAESAGDLAYETAINAAARGQAEAFDDLTTFIRLHPTHRFTADAEMALAELHLNQVPPRAVASREHLAAAASHSLTPAQKERSDYISIWLEVAAEDRAAAARLAVDFLKNWTASAHAADLTLLLGELSFVSAKYGDAFHWFSRHAVEFPLSPQAEAAEYFAALSAQRFPDGAGDQQAQALWTTLVGRRGPYAAEAQHELGLLHLKKEQFEAAIAAFDAVLALSPSPDLKSATLCDRGQALFARANLNAPGEEDWNRAIKSFSEVESDVSTPRSWRLQAAVRRGRCLERLGRPAEAITAYQTAMALPEGGLPGRTILIPVDEADWFYRAGFDAIRLLDLQKRHQEAVDIAEALAASNGPRSLEAGELATQIRLRHFLWETAPP